MSLVPDILLVLWFLWQVLVMTPMILLNALRHSFLRLETIKVLIFDECHNARGKDPYASIMKVSHICAPFVNHRLIRRSPTLILNELDDGCYISL